MKRARVSILLVLSSTLLGASCPGQESNATLVIHRAGQSRTLTDSARSRELLDIIRKHAVDAQMLQLAVGERTIASVRAGDAIEIVLTESITLAVASGQRIVANRLLVPLSGPRTEGANGSAVLFLYWGRAAYVSGPYSAVVPPDVLQRLRDLAFGGW